MQRLSIEMDRLSFEMGSCWLRRSWNSVRARRKYLASRYSALQQVSFILNRSRWHSNRFQFNLLQSKPNKSFFSADGNYEVTLLTKATVYFNGEVQWNPPAIYKSSCRMDVEWFPFDKQSCLMKFGSWTYDGNEVDLMHMKQEPENDIISTGINLTEFYVSVEWDVLDVPARKNEEFFPCCEEPYPGTLSCWNIFS